MFLKHELAQQVDELGVYGCYNSKFRSGLLNNATKKYRGVDLSKNVEMDQDHLIYTTQQENVKKSCASMENHEF